MLKKKSTREEQGLKIIAEDEAVEDTVCKHSLVDLKRPLCANSNFCVDLGNLRVAAGVGTRVGTRVASRSDVAVLATSKSLAKPQVLLGTSKGIGPRTSRHARQPTTLSVNLGSGI